LRVTKGFWIWGGFNKKQNIFLESIKEKVNHFLPSPDFLIHLTLAGPYDEIDNRFLESVKYYCKKNLPIKLNPLGFKYKQQTYESFYIPINYSLEIKKLRSNLHFIKKFPIENNFEPHISLAYGNHDLISKKELIDTLPNLDFSLNLSNLVIAKVDESIQQWNIIQKYEF